MLDGFRGEGSLSEGVKLPNGGHLKIAFYKNGQMNGESGLHAASVDNRILSLAREIQKAQPRNATILVSKDINLRIKADALGLQAEDYETDRVFITDLYTGMMEMAVAPDKIAAFRSEGEFDLDSGKKYFPNEYCALTDETNPKKAALTKVTRRERNWFPSLIVAKAFGESSRATANSILPSTRCSMTESNSSRSWAKPELEKRFWQWPQD